MEIFDGFQRCVVGSKVGARPLSVMEPLDDSQRGVVGCTLSMLLKRAQIFGGICARAPHLFTELERGG